MKKMNELTIIIISCVIFLGVVFFINYTQSRPNNPKQVNKRMLEAEKERILETARKSAEEETIKSKFLEQYYSSKPPKGIRDTWAEEEVIKYLYGRTNSSLNEISNYSDLIFRNRNNPAGLKRLEMLKQYYMERPSQSIIHWEQNSVIIH